MINKLIDHLERSVALSEEEKEVIRREVVVQDIEKNQVLLAEGEVSRAFYFVIKGCIRLYYNVGIEEKTAFFYLEDMFVSSYESFTRQIPARHNFQAIEDAVLAVISIEVAAKLLEASPKFEFLARIMMEEELIVYQEIISSFVTLQPEQRYLRLLESFPELFQRIPLHQIATYIGVTPETLSRIRKRIGSKRIS
ncbi:MAG: Crp/Fnr family transcriptional regulator [Chitinophagales bacterium]|nr:Crp/Fnr family transcriptional regulator [Chitinophagales bacterium]